jgi:hypothetical protein
MVEVIFRIHNTLINISPLNHQESEKLIRYNDGLRFGRPGFDSLQCEISFSPQRPDRLWSPPSLLSYGYREIFCGGKAAGM